MKRFFYAAFAGVVVLFAACTKKEVEAPAENQQPEVVKSTPVYITAGIDPETTKSTLDEVTGAFGFTNSDVIKIWDGTAMEQSESVAPDGSDVSKATIAFPAGFDEGGTASGWFTAFPASLVSKIEADGVTFTLPASYTYDEVGHEDPDISSVPCPMIGTYTHGEGISYKQAGAVIRIRLTNLAAGSLTFMFSSPVTGTMKLTEVSTEDTAGLVVSGMTGTGTTITVTNTPSTADGEFIFITLPVPVGTAPYEIAVINESNSATGTRMAAIKGSNTPLSRKGGWKLSASPEAISHTFKVAADRSVVIAPGNLMAKVESYSGPDKQEEDGVIYEYGYATASEWKFGGYFEYIGGTKDETYNGLVTATWENCTTGNDYFANAPNPNIDFAGALIGKWIDLFTFQGTTLSSEMQQHGLVNRPKSNWTGTKLGDTLYPGCWNTKENNNPSASGEGIYITNGGSYTWRPMTKDEWEYLLVGRASTGGATVGTFEHALHGRATVAGVKGLLIFPDGITWTNGGSICGSDALNTAMSAIAAAKGVPTNLNINTVDPDHPEEKDSYDFSISYSAYEFVSMAQSGIVFLPAAGFRGGSQIKYVQNYGRYWSSTASEVTGEGAKAYDLSFDKGKVQPVVAEGRTSGRSVRLVRDVTL